MARKFQDKILNDAVKRLAYFTHFHNFINYGTL